MCKLGDLPCILISVFDGHSESEVPEGDTEMQSAKRESVKIRAAGLIALTRRLTRLSTNRVKIFNRALIVNFSASHFRCKSCLITLIDLRSR